MNTTIQILSVFNSTEFAVLLLEVSPKLLLQFTSLVYWVVVITAVLPAFFTLIIWCFHVILYQSSTTYRERQDRGSATLNVICRIKDSKNWNDEIKSLIDTEYEKIQTNPSWYEWLLHQICLGGWDLKKNKLE